MQIRAATPAGRICRGVYIFRGLFLTNPVGIDHTDAPCRERLRRRSPVDVPADMTFLAKIRVKQESVEWPDVQHRAAAV